MATLEEMQKRGYNTTLITDDRCVKYLKNLSNIKVEVLTISRFSSNIFSNIRTIYFLITAILKSIFLFYKTKPSLVVGFGGYVAFPDAPSRQKYVIYPSCYMSRIAFLGR
ncbi:MAG UNVERIFIED_CONTAM: glycosyltransferase [Rickettsiaceae bacterium]